MNVQYVVHMILFLLHTWYRPDDGTERSFEWRIRGTSFDWLHKAMKNLSSSRPQDGTKHHCDLLFKAIMHHKHEIMMNSKNPVLSTHSSSSSSCLLLCSDHNPSKSINQPVSVGSSQVSPITQPGGMKVSMAELQLSDNCCESSSSSSQSFTPSDKTSKSQASPSHVFQRTPPFNHRGSVEEVLESFLN